MKEKFDEKIAIIGAGSVGVGLAEDLLNNKKAQYVARCFIDSDKSKVGRDIHGISVMSEDEAMDLLLSVPAQGMREVEGGEGIPSDTQWSCVYNLDDLTLQICTTRDKCRTYNYSLK